MIPRTGQKNRRPPTRRRRLLYCAAAAAAIAAGFFSVSQWLVGGGDSNALAQTASGEEPPLPAPVIVVEAVETMLAPLAEAPGATVSVADSVVAAETTGKVEWVAEIGAEIESGGVIARLDPADARLALTDARAEVSRLEARTAYLKRLVDRYEGLGEETGESEAALDEVRANHGEAVGLLERGRVAARRAALDLERTEITAPFNGRVVAREAEVGEFATAGAPMIRLVDVSRLEVTARASADMLASVKAGDEITVVRTEEEVRGRVRAVVPVGDDVTRTLEVRISLEAAAWPIGAPVRVRLPSASPRVGIAVPRDALILRADGAAVFRIGTDGVAVRAPVQLGSADGDLIEVIGAISAGDQVVIRGAERLRDGQKVEIKPSASPAASS